VQHILVDIETYGPCPGIHPMVSFAAIHLETKKEFYRELFPDTLSTVAEAVKIADSGLRGQAVSAEKAMKDFEYWLLELSEVIDERFILISDSTSFDHSFMTYYSWKYLGYSLFGHSSVSLNQVYKGMKKDMRVHVGNLRPKGSHTHNALDDVRGNMVALDKMVERGLRFKKEKK